jgi:MMP 1-O-methyltransferase
MNINEKIKDVEGWLSPDEAQLLYSLAKKTKGRGKIVEIGSWKGRSTICLVTGAQEAGTEKIIAIDPHTGSPEHQTAGQKIDTFAEFKKNISAAGLIDSVVPMVMTSRAAATALNEPIELCFIDGNHDYESAKEDFDLWFPKLIEGGIIAFHDTIVWPGPRKVVIDILFHSTQAKNIGFADNITFGAKVKKNSTLDRLKNHYIFFLKITFEFFQITFRKIKVKFGFLDLLKPLFKKIFQLSQ